MSLEAVTITKWDLQTKASPRSIAVFPAAAQQTPPPSRVVVAATQYQHNNPFAEAPTTTPSHPSTTETNNVVVAAVVFGTDRGSLHYRCYPSPSSSPAAAAAAVVASSTGSTKQQTRTMTTQQQQQPLGLIMPSRTGGGSSKQQQQQQQKIIPRNYLPMDLGSLPGSVVGCIPLIPSISSSSSHKRSQQQQQQVFVVCLVEDGGGGGGGGYATVLVAIGGSNSGGTTSHHHHHHHQSPPPSFQVLAATTTGSTTIPRMSCACAHGPMLVYGQGRSLQSLTLDELLQQSTSTSSESGGGTSSSRRSYHHHHTQQQQQHRYYHSNKNKQQQQKLYFCNLPNPVRTGGTTSSNICLSEDGKIAIVAAVNHTVYAVRGSIDPPGGEHNQDNENNSSDEYYNNCYKLWTFASSSQVHPVICLNVLDTTINNNHTAAAAAAAAVSSVGGSTTTLTSLEQQQHRPLLSGVGGNNHAGVTAAASASPQNNNNNCFWTCLFLANGRECVVLDLYHTHQYMSSKTRNPTVTFNSPILSAATCFPLLAILQSDGLVSIRSPSCLAIALRTVEVGPRPNDYFSLQPCNSGGGVASMWETSSHQLQPTAHHHNPRRRVVVATAYSGECKVLEILPDSQQDLADRLMKLAIDALGPNGFPRSELAEAVHASFTATSYVSVGGGDGTTTGAAAGGGANQSNNNTSHGKVLFQQYLVALLELTDFESGARSSWPVEWKHKTTDPSSSSLVADPSTHHHHHHHGGFASGAVVSDQRGAFQTASTAAAAKWTSSSSFNETTARASPETLLTGTALLCLVCTQLNPPDSHLASRAAKACGDQMGIVFAVSKPASQVCEQIAERILREASSKFSLLSGSSSSPTPIVQQPRSSQSNFIAEFVESAVWLLRSCGKHERAIDVAHERLLQNGRGVWSQIKYESYTATHLEEIWSAGQEEGCHLVLQSPATHRLLEHNPRLGLSVFTATHPQNEAQWRTMLARNDPLALPERVYQVLKLLKSINPSIPSDKDRSFVQDDDDGGLTQLPLESGRAVAVSFLRSAIGIATGRPPDDEEFHALPPDPESEKHFANFHDELSFLLLEGVISERLDDETNGVDTDLGSIYRAMLRELLKWQLTKIRAESFMESLPPSFLQEKALVLGRLGRHEDALSILYRDLESLDLALEYCDDRHAQQKARHDRIRGRQQQSNGMFSDLDDNGDNFLTKDEDNAYLPLVRVALESEDTERGTATAIKVLALRRGAIDRAAALRLLPSDVPVSAVARPFLIPALVDSESQVRRLTVVSALLRSRYLRQKDKLTTAQLKAQANVHVVPALKNLNLGDPLHSTKSFRAHTTSSTPGSTMPYVEIVKHFFPRHLVIQAKVTNAPYTSTSSASAVLSSSDRMNVLSDIAFVVAESSEEEAIQPLMNVPIQLLPPKMTGSAWCVLSAAPRNMDGPTAQLTCELRYSVQSVDSASAAFPAALGNSAILTRTFVEELQDLEVHASHFSYK